MWSAQNTSEEPGCLFSTVFKAVKTSMPLAQTTGAGQWLSDLVSQRVFSSQSPQRSQRANACSQAGNALSCIQGGLSQEPAVVRAGGRRLPDF